MWQNFVTWWKSSMWPAIRARTFAVISEWWIDIGEKPRPHFVSMVFGIAVYFAIKFAVLLAR